MKYWWLFAGGIVASVYSAFVAMCMWNWFATSALRVPAISFFEMLGLIWLIRLLTSRDADADAHRWTELWTGIEYLAGDERRQGLTTARAEVSDRPSLVWISLRRVIGDTVALVLGFVVHLLAM